jgi:hypothetical protein
MGIGSLRCALSETFPGKVRGTADPSASLKPSGRLFAIVLRSFIPLFRIPYLPLQIFGIKTRLIESFAGWVWHFFSITHHGCPCHVGDF